MSFVLTAYFDAGIQEMVLPSINNRSITMEIKKEITGLTKDVSLELDVFDNLWRIQANKDICFQEHENNVLKDGMKIQATFLENSNQLVILVEEIFPGLTEFDKYVWKSSVLSLGSGSNNNIIFDSGNLVSGQHALLEMHDHGIAMLIDCNSRNGIFVNGKRIKQQAILNYGDTIYMVGLKIIYLNSILAINRPKDSLLVKGLEPLLNEPMQEFELPEPEEFYQRSPRQLPNMDTEEIEIEGPPNPPNQRRQPIWMSVGPALTMVIPMTMGILFMTFALQSGSGVARPFMYMGIVTSGSAALIGVFWAIANYRFYSKQTRIDEENRQQRYRKYLEKIRAVLFSKHSTNREIMLSSYPHTLETMRWVFEPDRHLWERNVNHNDFLTIRLGMGSYPTLNQVKVPKSRFSLIDDDLVEKPSEIENEYKYLNNVPACLSLTEYNLIGIISDSRVKTLETARLIAAQIALFHSYTDAKMVFIYSAAEDWSFARWLPHVWSEDGGLRMVANDANSTGEILYHLSAVVRNRIEDENNRIPKRKLPHYILFIADPTLVENEAVMKVLINSTKELGFSVLLFYDRIDRLPNNCMVIIQRDNEFSGFYSLDNVFPSMGQIVFDTVTNFQLDETFRLLSRIRVREAEGSGAIPQLLNFLHMYKTNQIENFDIYRNWLENRTYESMRAIIGHRGGGTPLFLDIHEKYHGPHGLVAGTTGSGKSEILQTYILSMAMSYHPYEVSFILIDYKGGGMAESFRDLPHVSGIITNLGGNQTNRALASINSEIKRRQAVFNEYKVKHIDNYIELFRMEKVAEPIPHLIIIADEFAELKKEQPDFVREIVSASRVGRSLGVHLILATQKPAGIVDEQIRSNSKFRLCLRVQDKSDSQDMLKRPDAAYITQAGRAFFQVGNDEIFEEFQSGWSGASYEPEIPYTDEKNNEVRMINLWGRPIVIASQHKRSDSENKNADLQIDIITQHMRKLATLHNVKPISNIWLPPLPATVFLHQLATFAEPVEKGTISPLIGLIDDPINQEQRAFRLSFLHENHVLICGGISGGKTTLVQTILFSLASSMSPEQVQIYIADFGSRTLGVFGILPHVGDVVFDDNIDKVEKLIAMISKELTRRKKVFSEKGIGTYREYITLFEDIPAVILAIDNFAGFIENCPKQEDGILLLAREAASYGIFLLITCNNYSDIRGRIRQNIRFGIGLQLADRFEYEEVLGVRSEIIAESHVPGRGLIIDSSTMQKMKGAKEAKPLEFQVAIAIEVENPAALNQELMAIFRETANNWGGARAPGVPQIPTDMSYDAFTNLQDVQSMRKEGLIPLGYDLREAQLVGIELQRVFCMAISGAPRSGKTNALKALVLEAVKAEHIVYLIDAADRPLSNWARESCINDYVGNADELFSFASQILVPEFTRRNKKIASVGGRKFSDLAMHGEKHIVVFIHDMNFFLNTVYTDSRDMRGFFESAFRVGDSHRITIIANITKEDTSIHVGRPLLMNFIAWKEALHLGGQVDNQKILDFDLPPSERVRKLPAGQGHTMVDNQTVKLIMPLM